MSIVAHFYLDKDTSTGKKEILPSRLPYVRIFSVFPFLRAEFFGDGPPTSPAPKQVWLYECWEPLRRDEYFFQREPEEWKYILRGVESNSIDEWSPDTDERFDIGFEQPTENVNLDKLTVRLRSNLDLERRLKRYYRL